VKVNEKGSDGGPLWHAARRFVAKSKLVKVNEKNRTVGHYSYAAREVVRFAYLKELCIYIIIIRKAKIACLVVQLKEYFDIYLS